MASSAPVSTRFRGGVPYAGSCDCGKTRYIAFLSFPPGLVPSGEGVPPNNMLIYKCNCRPCHKMGMFHVRLKSAPDDFFLIAPTNLRDGAVLQDYKCDAEMVHWYFCKTCGVRCFAFMGVGETVEINVDFLEGRRTQEGKSGKTVKVWRPNKAEWEEVDRFGVGRSYLSVNAQTLDAQTLEPNDVPDLREWTEKNWIWYKDVKNWWGGDRRFKPHEGGCY